MRKILSCAAMAAMILLAWSADGAIAVATKTPAKKAARKKGTAAKKGTGKTGASKAGAAKAGQGASTAAARKPGSGTKSAASRGKKTASKRGVTWRNRQTAPSADRYREIQGALAAHGFLKPEDATGSWNQASSDALKKFQTEQNLESSGKINSLSLIALGLGPRHDVVPAAAPKPPAQ